MTDIARQAREAGFECIPAHCVDGSTWWWRLADDCLVHTPGHRFPWAARINGIARRGETAEMAVGSAMAAKIDTGRA